MLRVRRMNVGTTHGADFVMDRKAGLDCCLLLLTKTPAYFVFGGKEELVKENSAVLFTPGTPQHYRPSGESYSNHWAHIECDTEFLLRRRIRTNCAIDVSSAPIAEKLFYAATEVFYSNANGWEVTLHHILKALILSLPRPTASITPCPHISELIALRRQIYNEPSRLWRVDEMARELHLSTAYFQSIYKKAFSQSAIEDVIKSRLERVSELLLNTQYTAGEISEMSGYKNQEHFFRQFKKEFGQSPNEYRKLHSNEET